MSESDFLPLWENIKENFVENSEKKLINTKLNEIVSDRSEKSKKNRIIGTFASVFKHCSVEYEIKSDIKKFFNYEDFLTVSDQDLTESITEWLHFRLKSIVNGNGNNNINKVSEKKENLTSENNFVNKAHFSDFKDLPEMKINSVIELLKITKQTSVSKEQVAGLWEVFKIQNLNGEKYYQSKSDVYSHFINWSRIQKIEQPILSTETKSVKIKLKG
jgi:hypothetical protein